MDKATLIKIIEDIDMKDINEVKIEYVVEKSWLFNNNDKTEIIEIKK